MSDKLTPSLPLLQDKSQPGFELIDDIRELVKQNIKMIVLTSPGERVMIPDFGVGIRGLLFENLADKEVLSAFKGRIKDQIKRYLPYVELQEVIFFEKDIDENKISVSIRYYIPDLGLQEVIEF
jgi:phage baseplate assembly protein W